MGDYLTEILSENSPPEAERLLNSLETRDLVVFSSARRT